MYSAPYGGPTFAGATPPNPHLQPAPGPNQPQQMMYNPQQLPMGAQGPFPGGGGPNMMPAAGPAGMMQNTAMPHMAANGQMPYQTPYTNSPYGAGNPSSNGPQPQLSPNFNMMANSMPGFPMNAGGMSQQQAMMQRMHPGQQNAASMGMSTPQRQFSGPQGGPPTSMPSQQQQQQQFATPQTPHGTPHNQTPNNAHQNNPAISTPQTPTFASAGQGATVNGTSAASTPLSPGSESKEKEVFSLLLDINQELLCDSIQLQLTQQELKKEQAAAKAENGSGAEPQRKPSDEEKMVQQDYFLCMRRLQANLAYLASLADRKGAIPRGPQYLMAPAMNLSIKLRGETPLPASDSADSKSNPNADREERDRYLKELYKKLQALYPGVDPRKEPAFPPPAQNAGQGGQQGPNANKPGGAQNSSQGSPAPPGPRGTPQMTNVSGAPQAQAVTTA